MNVQQQQPPQGKSGLKVTGIVLTILGAFLMMLGLCTLIVGVGIIPLILGFPIFIAGLIMIALG